jgi:hypothetical protein
MHANTAWVREVVTGPLPEPELLPELERDGHTVRIDSNRDFQRIFEACLWRGVLPVRTDRVKRGQRRKVRFRICGLDLNIELKCRVRSIEDGVAVLSLQEFERHRRLLASLARDVPLLL